MLIIKIIRFRFVAIQTKRPKPKVIEMLEESISCQIDQQMALEEMSCQIHQSHLLNTLVKMPCWYCDKCNISLVFHRNISKRLWNTSRFVWKNNVLVVGQCVRSFGARQFNWFSYLFNKYAVILSNVRQFITSRGKCQLLAVFLWYMPVHQ